MEIYGKILKKLILHGQKIRICFESSIAADSAVNFTIILLRACKSYKCCRWYIALFLQGLNLGYDYYRCWSPGQGARSLEYTLSSPKSGTENYFHELFHCRSGVTELYVSIWLLCINFRWYYQKASLQMTECGLMRWSSLSRTAGMLTPRSPMLQEYRWRNYSCQLKSELKSRESFILYLTLHSHT